MAPPSFPPGPAKCTPSDAYSSVRRVVDAKPDGTDKGLPLASVSKLIVSAAADDVKRADARITTSAAALPPRKRFESDMFFSPVVFACGRQERRGGHPARAVRMPSQVLPDVTRTIGSEC